MGKTNRIFSFSKEKSLFILFLELSHRSTTFAKIIQDAERDIREIL